VIGGAEFPAVTKKDGDDFTWLEAGGDESAGEGLDDVFVFCVRDAAVAGSIDDGGLGGKAAAALEDEVVDETAMRVGVELGAEHAEAIVAETSQTAPWIHADFRGLPQRTGHGFTRIINCGLNSPLRRP
jgi:hypothetical protein